MSSAKIRFIAKQRDRTWCVYDTLRGSWPVQLAGVGVVRSNFSSEEECLVEAARLEAFYRR